MMMIGVRSEDCEELTARFEEKSLARFDGFHFFTSEVRVCGMNNFET